MVSPEGIRLTIVDPDADVDGIVALHRADAGGARPEKDTPTGWYRRGGPWMHPLLAASYLAEMQEHGALIWVAKREGRIFAEIEVEPLSPKEYFLGLIVVAPDLRGAGVGRTLLAEVMEQLRHSGGERMLTCPEPGVENFYVRSGFRLFEHRWRIEGERSAATTAVSKWIRRAALPGDLSMLLGHNQPPDHHRVAFFMRYFGLLERGRRSSELLSTVALERDLVIGLHPTGGEEGGPTWVSAWGRVGVEVAFQQAMDALAQAGGGPWFSYVSEQEAGRLEFTPTAKEAWWDRSLTR